MEAGGATAHTWQTYLDQAFAGDLESFGELWDAYLRPELLPYAYSLLENRDDAYDLVESVLVHLLEQNRYMQITRRDLDGFIAYLRVMVYNLYVDLRRADRQLRFWMTRQTFEQVRTAFPDADAIIAVLEHAPPLRPMSKKPFCGWLIEVLGPRHTPALEAVLLKYSRWEVRRTEALAPEHLNQAGSRNTMQEEADTAELLTIFYTEVRATLTHEEWLVVYHRHSDEQLTYRELAERIGIPRATLGDYYQKAKAKILKHPKLRVFLEI